MRKATAKGKHLGRAAILKPAQVKELRERVAEGEDKAAVARTDTIVSAFDPLCAVDTTPDRTILSRLVVLAVDVRASRLAGAPGDGVPDNVRSPPQ